MARFPKLAVALAATGVMMTATACAGGGQSGGNDEVTIRFADTLPKSHFISMNHSQRFIKTAEALAKERGHKLTVEFFPDGQLGAPADQIDNMQNGVFDMGLVAPSYARDQMPAGDVFNLPRMADSAGTVANAYYGLMQNEESELYARDFRANKLHPLSAFALPLYQIAMTSEIQGIESLKGKKLRSGGGSQNAIIKALGGIPVTMTTSEQYQGLQRGILDGGIFNTPSMIDNKTGEVLTSFTTNADVAGFVGGLAISESTWDGLPGWAKDVLAQAGEDATTHFAGMVDQLGKKAQKTLASEYGMKAVELSDSELHELERLLEPVKQQWVNKSGDNFNRAEVMKEAQAAIESEG